MRSWIRWRLVPAAMMLFFPPPRKAPFRPPRSVACLRPGKLGDMIVATPLFSALKQQGGVTRLAVLCSRANEPVIRHNPHIDTVRPVNFHAVVDVLKTIGWLRRTRFDALVDLTPGFSRTNFIISQCAGPGTLRAGIEKGPAAGRYHVHVGGLDTHLADRILDTGETLAGARFSRPRPFEIYTAPSDREASAAFVGGTGVIGPLVGINLSAGGSGRQWAYGHFAELVRRLASAGPAGMKMALFSVGEQREWARVLAASHSSCVAVPEFPFLTVTEIIAACSLLISCDTALIHAAAARNVPVVGLYTAHAENFTRWGPYGIACEVLRSPAGESVNAIGPDAVYEKAMRLMEITEH